MTEVVDHTGTATDTDATVTGAMDTGATVTGATDTGAVDETAPGSSQRYTEGRAITREQDRMTDAVRARLAARAPSVPRLFADRVAASPDGEAFRYRSGAGWNSVTWREADARIARVAAGLLDLGIARGDRVGLVASTRYEWIVADLGIMAAGGACASVFPTTGPEDTAHILADSGARVVVVEDVDQLAKLAAVRGRVPAVERVVVVDVPAAGLPDGTDRVWVTTLDAVEDAGAALLARDPGAVQRVVAGLGPDDLAALVYTSGTTGSPKGARLVHDCWTYQAAAIAERELLTPDDVQFLWLPLAHAFGGVMLAAQLAVGFVTAVDGRVDRLVENMAVQRPTFVAAAPRIFEKVHAAVAAAATGSPARKRVYDVAFAVGRRVHELERAGRPVPATLRARRALADRLVFSKIRARFGGRLRFFISGAARLNPDQGEWFAAAGITLLQGYGLTETSGAIFVTMPWRNEIGRVGAVFPGCEARIADDGELFLRGPSVMHGYHGQPAGAADGVLDADGWLATGDIGNLVDGYLEITDRKKDLIKTSGGKYVAPQKIENMLTSESPYLAAAMVLGDGERYCAALLAVDPDAIAPWAREHGLGGLDYDDLVATDEVRELLGAAVDAVNARLSHWETLKTFQVLPEPPSEGNGMLTATLKVRRQAVSGRHPELVARLFGATPAGRA